MSGYFHSETYSISCDSSDLQMSIHIWVDIILEILSTVRTVTWVLAKMMEGDNELSISLICGVFIVFPRSIL